MGFDTGVLVTEVAETGAAAGAGEDIAAANEALDFAGTSCADGVAGGGGAGGRVAREYWAPLFKSLGF